MATQATKQATKPKTLKKTFEPEKVENDLLNLIAHIKENPLVYVAGVAFVFVCIIASVMYRAGIAENKVEAATAFARAMDSEDPILRAAALKGVADGGGEFGARACYMMAEAFYDAANYDEAQAAYERVRKDFASSPYVPDAIEGLGYLAENKGEVQAALALYKEIQDNYKESFTARRQDYNIGRCQEALGQVKEAVASYNQQVTAFPGSGVERQATTALERLKKTNPELFPTADITPAVAPDAAPSEIAPSVDLAPAAGAESAPAAEQSAAPTASETEGVVEPAQPSAPAPGAETNKPSDAAPAQ
jgi:tetratricopeptide (TPR) repeat protein